MLSIETDHITEKSHRGRAIVLITGDGWKPGKLAASWISAAHRVRFYGHRD
jgi:hypothetical protein